jgi:imidazoleglycerol-phosphate dehydratase/histidinol-phosphatase
MLTNILIIRYDLANSFVLGDRLTDVELAKTWCKGSFMNDSDGAGERLAKEKS